MILPQLHRRTLPLFFAAALGLGLASCATAASEDDVAAAAALVEQGITELQQGDADSAEATFERALRLDEEQHLAHYNLGVIDQGGNRAEDAREHYDEALDLAPDHGPSLYNLAIMTESDDLEAAVDLYRRAIEAQPAHGPSYMRLGFALNHLGRTAEAEPMLTEALRLDPSLKDVEAPHYE